MRTFPSQIVGKASLCYGKQAITIRMSLQCIQCIQCNLVGGFVLPITFNSISHYCFYFLTVLCILKLNIEGYSMYGASSKQEYL